MDYEKKYKELLERAKLAIKECGDNQGHIAMIESIFPELKESEDEKIKRVIRGWIYTRPSSFFDNGISKEEMLAWLKKQGESKPIGKLQLSEELYEHIRNTCACIDDALSSETLADINDYLSMAKRSAYSAFDMIEKEGKQKSAERWKPSSEQLRVLSRFRSVGVPDVRGNDLVLFDELFKKLCEL